MGINGDAGDPRVYLAIERTFLAWTRTALALMGFGFVVARLGLFLTELAVHAGGPDEDQTLRLAQSSQSLSIGVALVVLGAAVQAFAVVERRELVRSFKAETLVVPLRWSIASLLGLALVGVGVAIAAYLVRLPS
jgi:putative membrane protein